MVDITVAADGDMGGMLTRGGASGWSKAGSTCVPVKVALSCSARFKASWMRLIVSFPWGYPVVRIGAAGRPVSPRYVRLRPDQTFRMTEEPVRSWLRRRL